jgi:hypothetical protein
MNSTAPLCGAVLFQARFGFDETAEAPELFGFKQFRTQDRCLRLRGLL